MRRNVLPLFLALSCVLSTLAPIKPLQAQAPNAGSGHATLLKGEELTRALPATVFFRGQSAPIQARNSGGVQFPDKHLILVMLVDTAGYSTSVQEKYQAYLITEVALDIDGHRLPPGAYGCGFLAGDRFIVQDLGAHDLFTARSTRDAALKRPTPLEILPAPGDEASFRLYAGRSYTVLHRAE